MAGEIRDETPNRGWLYHPAFPEHWTPRSLHSMARWVNGIAFKDIEFKSSGRPVIKIAEIKGGISSQTKFTEQEFDEPVRVRPGDLLFSWSGQPETSINAYWWHGPEGWLNQHVYRVTPEDGVDKVFLYYLLRYLKPNFVAIAGNKQTTGLGHVTKRDMENLEVACPGLPEQRAIARVLGALDKKIRLNWRMNEALDGMARAMFRDWFVDFGPTRAKMEGRAPYLPEETWSLFPGHLDADGNPEGWNAGTISDIAILNPEKWPSGGYPDEIEYVDLSNTKWGTIKAIAQFTSDDAPASARHVLRSGDTIIGKVRPGNGSYALVSEDGLTGSTGFAVLRPTREIYREVTYLAATSPQNIDRLAHLADGAAYPSVRPDIVAETKLVAPVEGVFSAFSIATGGLIDRAEAGKRENRTLASIRDTLLPRLVSGELRAGDAETLLDRVS